MNIFKGYLHTMLDTFKLSISDISHPHTQIQRSNWYRLMEGELLYSWFENKLRDFDTFPEPIKKELLVRYKVIRDMDTNNVPKSIQMQYCYYLKKLPEYL